MKIRDIIVESQEANVNGTVQQITSKIREFNQSVLSRFSTYKPLMPYLTRHREEMNQVIDLLKDPTKTKQEKVESAKQAINSIASQIKSEIDGKIAFVTPEEAKNPEIQKQLQAQQSGQLSEGAGDIIIIILRPATSSAGGAIMGFFMLMGLFSFLPDYIYDNLGNIFMTLVAAGVMAGIASMFGSRDEESVSRRAVLGMLAGGASYYGYMKYKDILGTADSINNSSGSPMLDTMVKEPQWSSYKSLVNREITELRDHEYMVVASKPTSDFNKVSSLFTVKKYKYATYFGLYMRYSPQNKFEFFIGTDKRTISQRESDDKNKREGIISASDATSLTMRSADINNMVYVKKPELWIDQFDSKGNSNKNWTVGYLIFKLKDDQ
jgi:hypothetical protein